MAKRCHSVNGLFLAPCCCRTKLQRKANSITADDAGEPTVSAVTSAFVPPSGPRERASTRPALQFHRLSSQPGATVQHSRGTSPSALTLSIPVSSSPSLVQTSVSILVPGCPLSVAGTPIFHSPALKEEARRTQAHQ
ncbi:uncharacterized protein LJ206_007488 isoform 2-T3 [Theristicus caerulescens]